MPVKRAACLAATSLACACSLTTSFDDLRGDAGGADAGDAAVDVAGDVASEAAPDAAADATDAAQETDAPLDGADAGMIELVASASASSTNPSATVMVQKPTNTALGDFVWILLCFDDETATATVPGNWQTETQLTDLNVGFQTIAYSFFAGPSEPSTYSITLSASLDWAILAVTYSGVRATTPFDVTPSFAQLGASTTFTAPSMTTHVAHALALYAFTGESGDGTWNVAAPLTARAQQDFVLAADMPVATPGAVAAQSVGYSSSSRGMALTAALAPE